MDLLDGLLGQVTENFDIQNLATKSACLLEQVEAAVHALGVAHPQPGDTVVTAAASTGLSSDILQQIVTHIGGEGSLASFASLLSQQGGGVLGGLGQPFRQKLTGLFAIQKKFPDDHDRGVRIFFHDPVAGGGHHGLLNIIGGRNASPSPSRPR